MFQVFVVLVFFALFWLLGGKKDDNRGEDDAVFAKAWGVSFSAIKDRFSSLEAVQEALRQRGLESSELVVGVDFTQSNTYSGAATYGGRSLHEVSAHPGELNPYQQVLRIVANTLRPFDDDHLIPAYGFGDARTKDRAVFSFKRGGEPCNGLEEVEALYTQIAQEVALAGPTSFAPLIYRAIDIVRESENSYHILLIIADGQVTNEAQTIKAIVEASKYPLSIIVVGVGDGPWDMMKQFDDKIPQRQFDNFQFVNFEDTKTRATAMGANLEAAVALNALMEIPDQFQIIRKLGLISNTDNMPPVNHKIDVLPPPGKARAPTQQQEQHQQPAVAQAVPVYEAHMAPSAPPAKHY